MISAAYRLLPQAGAEDLLEDVAAAYKFAKSWKSDSKGVIVAGASAGKTSTSHGLEPHAIPMSPLTRTQASSWPP